MTKTKKEIYWNEIEEYVYGNDLEKPSCEICESKFKSSTNLKRHDQRFHLKQGLGNEFKCDFCNEIFAEKKKYLWLF